MPVAWSIVLSISVSLPSASCVLLSADSATTSSGACCWYWRISSSMVCGRVKLTKIGLSWLMVTSAVLSLGVDQVADIDQAGTEPAFDR